jgi:hypothetical protein
MTTPGDPNYGTGGQGYGQQPLTPLPVQDVQDAQEVPQWGQGGAQAPPAPYQQYPQAQAAYYPVGQAQPKRRNKSLIIRLSLLGIVLAVVLVSVLVKHFSAAKVDADGNVTKAGSLSVFSLQKGQCFNEPDSSSAVSSIKAVPCGEAHDAQVTGNIALTESAYDKSALDDDAGKQCQTMADGTVDESKLGADASIIYFVPNEEDWNSGDHGVTCALDEDGVKMTGTVLK